MRARKVQRVMASEWTEHNRAGFRSPLAVSPAKGFWSCHRNTMDTMMPRSKTASAQDAADQKR